MPEDSPREIQIGDAKYTVVRFKGLKASIAAALVSRVMEKVPELQDMTTEFRRRFRESNTIAITPAMAKLPTYAGIGLVPEDFAAGGGKVEFPEEPSNQAVLVHIFPKLFDLADKELRRFFALMVIPNSELEEADDADEVEEVLSKWGKKLLRQGDLEELLELVVVGGEVLREQLARKKDVLGKIQWGWLQAILADNTAEALEEPTSNGHGPTEEETPTTTTTPTESPQSQNSTLDSSSDLEDSSAGVEKPLSTTSPGMN